MKLSAVLTIAPFFLAPTFASYLTASYYSDEASCSGSILAEAFIPMGKCIKVPALPPELNLTIPAKSFKSTCTQNSDGSISTSNLVYASQSDCSGIGVPLKEDIPAGCQEGALLQCIDETSSSVSLTNNWPAVGAYFGDSACSSYDLLFSMVPDTCAAYIEGDGTGYSVELSEQETTYELKIFKDVTDCSGAPAKDSNVPEDQCMAVSYSDANRYNSQNTFFEEGYHTFANIVNIMMPSLPINADQDTWAVQQNRKSLHGKPFEGATPFIYASNAQNIK
jgi:hypothetical protein